MHRTLTRLLSGQAISAGELSRLLKTSSGVVALAALSRAHIKHQAATAELKRPPRQMGKVRIVPANPAAKKSQKASKKRPL